MKENKDRNNNELNISEETEGIDFDKLIAEATQYLYMGDILEHIEKKTIYVVQIPLKYKEAFEEGKLILNRNETNGTTWPSLYKIVSDGGRRQFVANLPIKQETIGQNSPFEGLALNYHNLIMEKEIDNLANLMKETYQAVERIEQGQMDDRIGILMAGRDQIIYALNLQEEKRNTAIALGRNQIITAQRQIYETFKRRVSTFTPVPNHKAVRLINAVKDDNYYIKFDNAFTEIQKYYQLYLQATDMLAASYIITGDTKNAEMVFETAVQDIHAIDFTKLKTLSFIHHENIDLLYYDHNAETYLINEKEIYLSHAETYQSIDIKISGEELLEAFKHDRKEKIHSTGTE